ncbi:DNA repair protein [Yarrowia sp. B02]|nr:DNA repair protein [Yarrowia sp. B02]
MGVRGLWEIVQSTARPVKVETLGGNRLAVDASIWIYQFLKTTRGAGKKNAHLVGFFRRILKLLFLGIRPVFVFDGVAPELKRKTVARRRERREGRIDSMEKEAKRILAMQLENREKRQREDEDDEDDYVKGSELLSSDTKHMLKKLGGSSKKQQLKSDYDLPDLDVNIGQDDRFLTQKELEERAELHNLIPHVAGDGSLDISTTIDFDSDYFRSLPDATKYELLNGARLRSRLRMGHTAEQLQRLYPDSESFSKFQVNRVALRNNYTQRLMQLVGLEGDLTLPKEHETVAEINRVSGEKGKQYVMEKNEDGWTLAMHDGGGDRDSPVLVDDEDGEQRSHDFGRFRRKSSLEREQKPKVVVKKEEIKEESDDEDWEDVDIDEKQAIDIDQQIRDAGEDLEMQQSILNSLDDDKKAKLAAMTKTLELKGLDGLGEMDWGAGIFAPEKEEEVEEVPQETYRDQKVWRPECEEVESATLVDDLEAAVDEYVENKEEKSEVEEEEEKSPEETLPVWFQQSQDGVKSAHQAVNREEESDSDEEAGLYYGGRAHSTREVVELSDDDDELVEKPLMKPATKSVTKSVAKPTPTPAKRTETVTLSDSDSDAEFESVSIEPEKAEPDTEPEAVPEIEPKKAEPEKTEASGDIFGTGSLSLDGGIFGTGPLEPSSSKAASESVSDDAVKPVADDASKTAVDTADINDSDLDDHDKSFENMVLAEEEAVEDMQTSQNLIKNFNREQEEFEKQFKLEEEQAKEMRMALMEELEQINQTQKGRDSTNEEAITQTMIDECQQLLQLFGIPFITAPTEAEAQCATLVNLDLVDGVITEDSDVFLFSSNPRMRVFKNFFNSNKYVECYKTGEIAQTLNLERKDLVDLALLLGSDYTDGLPGIGPVSAMEILAEFKAPGKDTLREFKDWWDTQLGERAKRSRTETSAFKTKFSKRFLSKLFLGASFPSEKIRLGYLEPSVDDDKTPFKWGHPSLVGLREYLGETIGGNSIDSLLLPVLQQMNAKQNRQTQILDFLPNGNETSGSTRIAKALTKIKQRAKDKRDARDDKGKDKADA